MTPGDTGSAADPGRLVDRSVIGISATDHRSGGASADGTPDAPPAAFAPTGRRFAFFALVFAMYMISYGDRAALSIALPALGREFTLTPIAMGWISSSFLWSYLLLNLPSTIALDVVGARRMGTVAVTVWSAAMILGGFVQTLWQFVLSRVMLGVGESPTFGIGATVVRHWAGPRERGTVMTILLTGIQLGLAGGTIAGAFLVVRFGWRAEFVVLGMVGLAWAVVWRWVYRDPPAPASGARRRVSRRELGNLFRSRSFHGILSVQCTQAYMNFLISSWLPLYLIHELKVDVTGSGSRTAICYVAAAFGAIALGRLIERGVVGRDRDPSPARRRFVVALCVWGAAGIGLLPSFHTVTPILSVLAVSLAFLIAANGANTALLTELVDDGSKIGAVTGVSLTVANSLGLIAPIMTGYVVTYTGSFDVTWYLCAVALLVAGAASILLVGPAIALRDDGTPV